MYLSMNFEGEVARLPVAGKAFLALIINILCVIISDAHAPCFRCIENLNCLQAQEGDDDDAFEEPLHLYYCCY